MAQLALKFGTILFPFLLASCVGAPPVKDYTLARAALDLAKKVQAPQYAPGFYSRAEEAYSEASKLYEDRNYDRARDKFRLTRKWAERAENATRLEKFKSGDGFL